MPPEQRLNFPGELRLRKRADFQRLYTRGRRIKGRYVVLFVMQAETDCGRYGVTATRKIGGAVIRARSKRRLRELYRLHRYDDGVEALDIVANARFGCARAPWAELEQDFLRCLGRGRRCGTTSEPATGRRA